MASNKPRPDGVPEENVYNRFHWTLYPAILGAVAAVYLLITAGG